MDVRLVLFASICGGCVLENNAKGGTRNNMSAQAKDLSQASVKEVKQMDKYLYNETW